MTDRRNLLVTSIHDVSPRFESAVDRLVDELQPWVGMKLAMLVVPNHWGESPIRPGSAFATKLRKWSDSGAEMLLHGYYHRDDSVHVGLAKFKAAHWTASEGEFLGLSRAEAGRRIAEGRALLEDVTGRRINAFVAPAWLYGPGSKAALADAGFAIAEDHLRVWSPATGTVLARGPVITWASRSPWRMRSSLAASALLRRIAPQRVLRVAVHPGDCGSPELLTSIRRTLAVTSRARRPALYSELGGAPR